MIRKKAFDQHHAVALVRLNLILCQQSMHGPQSGA
jgi:hypothetical protein